MTCLYLTRGETEWKGQNRLDTERPSIEALGVAKDKKSMDTSRYGKAKMG